MANLARTANTRGMAPTSHVDPFRDPLDRAHRHAVGWLESLDERPVSPIADADAVGDVLGRDLPDGPTPPEEVVDLLATGCEPGLVGMPSGRFYGFVIGGTQPAALAADWLVSAWDQNTVLRKVTPGVSAVEEMAGSWFLDLLELPPGSGVGFATGATMANFTGLAAARDATLRKAGWDLARGLFGAPAIRVLAGRERHASVDLALRYLGLPAAELVDTDEQGRVLPQPLREALAESPDQPTIVLLQAGNLHSGACDPFQECVPLAHEHGAWVHVDGAFGLWAAASPTYRHLTAGVELADSWATDAHKTLNVPYDCGIVAVRDAAALNAATGAQGDYFIPDAKGDPMDRVPEMSRRARGVPVWAALRASGRSGVVDMVDRLCRHACTFADALGSMPGVEVLNDVVFTQVCVSFGTDEQTLRVVDRMLSDGVAWMSGSRWRDRAVLRIAVSNAATTDEDVTRSLDALRSAAADAAVRA